MDVRDVPVARWGRASEFGREGDRIAREKGKVGIKWSGKIARLLGGISQYGLSRRNRGIQVLQ
jgi:hypothetical protein